MSAGKFDIRSPFNEKVHDGKENHIFEREARKTVGEKIKGLFAIVCAQTKTMLPGEDNKQDLGSLWMQAAGVIAQVMNTDNVDKNTEVQRASYKLGMGNFVGRTHEGESDQVKFDGEHSICVRTNMATPDIRERVFQVVSEQSGAIVRSIIMSPDETEVTWNGDDNHGTTLNPGAYRVRIRSINAQGKEINQPTRVDRVIDGVGYDDKGMPYFTHDQERIYEINKWTKPQSILIKPNLNRNI